MSLRWAAAVGAAVSCIGAPAFAGDEKKCAEQYTFEEQQMLEWAALGGDPHAQYAMAQCALPDGVKKFTAEEKTYAVKWVTLAACDAEGDEERHRISRKLRDEGDLSFRRFGGVSEDEKFTKRERRFVEYREQRARELEARVARLDKVVDRSEEMIGRTALADELARFGPLGLTRLATLATCSKFNASDTTKAAIWAAAAETWSRNDLASVYGPSRDENWSIDKTAVEYLSSLTPSQRRTAEFEIARLMKSDPERIHDLEQKAALGRLQELEFVGGNAHSTGEGVGLAEGETTAVFAGQSVTIAVQFALESLGWMEFTHGPDNDYGPSTIEAVARAQEFYGKEPTRWLSHADARQMICDAAIDKRDPVSLYHLSVMFSRGWGFPIDLVRARFAVAQAETALEEKLRDVETLPEWKRRSYFEFRPRIAAAKTNIETAWSVLPETETAGWSGRLSFNNLCQ